MIQKQDGQFILQIIAEIDKIISKQLNAILHHQRFKQLESSWRGLLYLANQSAENYSSRTKLKVLDIAWAGLARDLSRATEFDQSQLFLKIYNNEFGHPGGEPFGILIGDYYVSHKNDFPVSDIDTLRSIAKVAAAAFVPFITAMSPSLLGLDSFAELEREINLERTFQQSEYQLWKEFRQDEDCRFIGLVLPHVLIRLPYSGKKAIRYPFIFEEEIHFATEYLWGNAAYCFAAVVLRSFNKTGWFTDIRGMHHDSLGGQVTHLPLYQFGMDNSGLDIKPPVNVVITDHQEKLISDYGFIPLSYCAKSNNLVFYGCSSLQTLLNNKLSTMLHYILCVCRFSHYIKVIARDKMGTFATPEECEKYLQNWLRQYTTSSANLSYELKAKYPLREAKVIVKKRPGSLGSYLCTIHISPHYQFDRVQAYLELSTEFLANI